MFKIETGYYLELLTPKTMKLLGSTKHKIKKTKMVKVFLINYRISINTLHYC